MATRYVWGQYNLAPQAKAILTGVSNHQIAYRSDQYASDVAITIQQAQSITTQAGSATSTTIVLSNPTDSQMWGMSGTSLVIPQGTYFAVENTGGGFSSDTIFDVLYATAQCTLSASAMSWGAANCTIRLTGGSATRYSQYGAGSLITNLSNSGSSAYPTNGRRNSYWYTYQGSDSIDATAVGYSNQSPMGGQSITINVTPTTPTYGGTIQYTYQVQLSGGSWTTIATKTTATSQQYTIPAGATSFAARVVANDTWGFSSSTYTTGSTLTVTNNQPPTAPGSISIGSVVGGQQCTITWTAATDPDGTVVSYQLERQTDNGDTWTQIYSGADLTYTDTINADWATVNYRVKATDDDGDSGPYATGTMQTVNDGWLYFSGPPSDMGEQPAPFAFVFSIGSTGTTSASNIAVTAIYDDQTIYTGTVASAQQITLNIDTRLTYAGTHDIIVTATADGFLAVNQVCTFTVPEVSLPDGGAAGIMEDDAGNTYYPATLARYVIGLKGLDANALFDRVYTGTYTGTGTSGSGNPCSVRTSFEPTLVFIQAAAASTATSGYWVNSAPGQSSQGNMIVNNNGTVTLCPVTWDAEAMTLSWYGTSAAAQLNASGTVYGIIALGGMA